MIPDGLEPSLSGCRPEVVAAGLRDRMNSSCGSWNRTNASGVRAQNRYRLRPSSSLIGRRPRLFYQQQRSRIVKFFRRHAYAHKVRQLRGQESNLRTRDSKSRISTSRNYPAWGECPAGIEPACPAWKAGTSAARPRARVVTQRKP